MGWAGLKNTLFGTITVSVKGQDLEKLINTIYRHGIVLWHVRRISVHEFYFNMYPHAFKRLRPIIRHSGVKLKIVKRQGFPFFWQRLYKRKGFLIGLALGVLIVYALSSFVWFVDVSGNKRLSTQQILQQAGAIGIRPGIWRSEVDTAQAARRLKESIPQAAWVGVTLKGTRVEIQIVEKVDRPAPKPGKGNLIAAKTGLVTDVLVIKGVPQVSEGQTVKKGQTLITAENLPAAEGFVRARVWYTGKGAAKLVDEGVKPTGNTSTSLRIKIGSKVIILTGRKSPFTLYREQTSSKSLPQWRNIHIPVEIITVTYQEMVHYKKVMSKSDALRAAEIAAKEDLQTQLPEKVKLLGQHLFLPKTIDPNVVLVNIDAETLEEIAVHQAT